MIYLCNSIIYDDPKKDLPGHRTVDPAQHYLAGVFLFCRYLSAGAGATAFVRLDSGHANRLLPDGTVVLPERSQTPILTI